MNKLDYLLKLTQEELKIEVYNYLQQKNMKPIYDDGYVYAEGDIPILLVAHMDTVFSEPPKILSYNKEEDKIFNPDGGLGGDDRSGVYAIMRLLNKYRPYVLFTEDEEIGCVGAEKAVSKLSRPNVKYIIEFDRRGNNDCIFYDCGNEEFMKYVESFGFATNYGTCSDISVLGSEWDIASVNLSSGYYNEHTEKEYIIFHELIDTINRVDKMINEYKKVSYFDYQKKQYTYKSTYSLFDDWVYKDLIWWLEETNLDKYTYSKDNQDTDKKLSLKKDNNKSKKMGDK